MSAPRYTLGLDIGSTTCKAVAVALDGRLLHKRYVYSHGNPGRSVLGLVEELFATLGDGIANVTTSGSGGRRIAEILDARHMNEIVAQLVGLSRLRPEARSVIEMGGQDSKFMSVSLDPHTHRLVLLDFAMNDLCAAGTGSFLDQQAEKLGIPVAEFARLASTSDTPARIAGRCTVFAKSDMIHLQQVGTPTADILAGLCFAVVRNYRATVGRGKTLRPPVAFQGGVAFNGAVVRAFQEVLRLKPDELVIPEHHEVMAAYGCGLDALERLARGERWRFPGLDAVRRAAEVDWTPNEFLGRLLPVGARAASTRTGAVAGAGDPASVSLGVDVGSTTVKAVLLDEAGRLVSRAYRPVNGQPVESLTRLLLELGAENTRESLGDAVEVRSVGVTGSGRHLLGRFIGADVVVNEITAQAEAAIRRVPDADTVFEIGGQDSKFIRIEDGVVVDFEMNKACAAGTGSFLEEQSGRLDLDVERDFAPLAFTAERPCGLGERCTVFMESDIVSCQQRGASKNQVVAGLAYSIAENYLNKVVGQRKPGRRILFQGGVAHNDAVVAAFRGKLGQQVLVPPDHDVTGAIGVAWIASRNAPERTGFHGFDLRERSLDAHSFVCKACPNLCEVKRVRFGGRARDAVAFYGARCDMYERETAGRVGRSDTPDAFERRRELLFEGHVEPSSEAVVFGLPQALYMWDLFPYFSALLRGLGFGVKTSGFTGARVAQGARTHANTDTCYPLKTVLGHLLELGKAEVDAIFYPNVISRPPASPGMGQGYLCPYVQGAPFIARAALADLELPSLLVPTLWLDGNERRLLGALYGELRRFGVRRRRLRAAHREAREAQRGFERRLLEEGSTLVEEARGRLVTVIGRAYATCDPGLNMDLPRKLRGLGLVPLPLDMLDTRGVTLRDTHADMYWRSGQQILAAGRRIAREDGLEAIYYSCYGCGPDTFLLHAFRQVMRGKPHLVLEVDEHAADAGIQTRLEAFWDSLQARRAGRFTSAATATP